MIGNYLFLLLCLLGILACFLSGTVIARETIVDGFPIHGGYPFPYQVSVQLHHHGHVCGGGIIGEQFILTAAHCLLNETRHLRSRHISIVAGTNNLNTIAPPALTVQVKKVFFSSEFHPAVEFKHGDIAVLKLVCPMQLLTRLNLRKLELVRQYGFTRTAVVAGFGWNKYATIGNEHVGSTDGKLRYAMSYILPNNECDDVYTHGAIQSDKHLCSDKLYNVPRTASVCIGDGGTPLVHNQTYVIGILSRIPSRCDERLEEPAIYTRVLYYTRMIMNVMDHDHDPEMISLNV